MRVTADQLDTLSRERMLAVVSRIAGSTLPHRLAPGEDPRGVVSRLLALGREYGVTGERGLARFVCLALILGEERVRQPEMAQRFRASQSPDALASQLLRNLARKGTEL